MNASRTLALGIAAAALPMLVTVQGQPQDQDEFRFKSGVELVNVTATVSDGRGRFVAGLTKDDFLLYDDDIPQAISYFSAERVPVSLGIVLDVSGSMAGDKIEAARAALDRFLYDLLGPDDEVFLYIFADQPRLTQDWTTNRAALSKALDRVTPSGGTAMYDTVAEAVPLAELGRHPKKALLVISDGDDTSSRIGVRDVKQLIRGSEVLVYAIGIDGEDPSPPPRAPTARPQPRRPPIPVPFPGIPGRRPGGRLWQQTPQIFGPASGWPTSSTSRVNVAALRELTDDSGGRTEVIRGAFDLRSATAGIADELSKQYHLGYASNGDHDGRWHSIRVVMRTGKYEVRARRGYVAN
jgi:VWFA-related protein